jgi:hypothetical protein
MKRLYQIEIHITNSEWIVLSAQADDGRLVVFSRKGLHWGYSGLRRFLKMLSKSYFNIPRNSDILLLGELKKVLWKRKIVLKGFPESHRCT